MYDPDGYRPVSFFVELLAIWGEQGKLPRRLGFVHPGDAARPDDLPAKVTASLVLGELLAAGAIPAEAILDPSGLRFPVPAHYWSSSSARATMHADKLDLAALGFAPDLHLAYVYLATDKVVAALGIRLVPPEEPAPLEPKLQLDDAWMQEYATRFLAENKRPPSRDADAVPDANSKMGVHRARSAYARLPPHLKNPARKPRKSKQE
jgi:hypothetical protein